MKKKTKTLGQLKKELDKYFNRWIRLRDCFADRFKDLSLGLGTNCIACGEWKPFEELDCGHYFAKGGYDGLRFNEDNSSAECRGCNRFNDSHLIGYGINLHNKIGEERYNQLLAAADMYRKHGNKYYRHEIEGMIKHYKYEVMLFESRL